MYSQFDTAAPSYPVGNSTVLGYVDIFDDGAAYGLNVANDGTVTVDGQVDPNLTATFRQIEAAAPGAVATAKENGGWSLDSIMDNLTQIVGTVVQAKAQRDLLKANLRRAEQGLPPINAQAYMPGVNVGVSSDTQKMIYTLGGAALAVLVLSAVLNSRGGRGRGRR